MPSLATSLVPGQVNTGGRVLHTQGSFAAFLPRFNILYRFSPALNGFATVSKGRRSPTVNLDAAPGGAARISQIAEENVWNYEVGLKGNSGIFSGSLGVYYQKYDNFQVSVVGSDGVARTMSAGTASNLGVEAEVMVQPTNWLNIFANGGYIDGGIDDKAANGRFAGDQFRLARCAGGAHGRNDAAAGSGNFLIGGAGQAQLELGGAIAAMDQMGVAVDQARRDPAAGAVDRLCGGEGRRFNMGASIGDTAIARGDHAVLDRADPVARHRRQPGIGP